MLGDVSKKRAPIILNHKDVKKREPVIVRPRGTCIDAPPYKDSNGKWRTVSLFVETFDPLQRGPDGEQTWQKFTPIFTLREHPFNIPPSSPFLDRYNPPIIPSLREIYLSYNDPTEYQFATEVLYSTYHWKHLCGLTWFKPYIEEWRRTLVQKLRGIGIAKMVEVAGGSDPKFALMAGKWLGEGKFAEPEVKGRPSKQEVAQSMRQEKDIEKIFEDDAKRLGIESKEVPSVFVDLGTSNEQTKPN
jgi:hypothetical protein